MTLSPPSLTSHAIFEQYLCSTSHLGTFKYVSVHVGVQIRASWSCFFLLFGPDVALLWMNVFLSTTMVVFLKVSLIIML